MQEYNLPLMRLLLAGAGLGFFGLMELMMAYRPATVSKAGRWGTNIMLAAANNVLLAIIFGALIASALAYTQSSGSGLFHRLGLAPWQHFAFTLLIYDLVLYGWHRLNHTLPFLQRFHQVHHSDLNMDVTTAMRYHAGELAISMVIKLIFIIITGVDADTLFAFEAVLLACVQLHHSSIRVPAWFDNLWQILLVPPAMHRIHHSTIAAERNSNYGAIFSFWDRIFGSFRRDVDQVAIRIGLPAYPQEGMVTFGRLWAMPLQHPVGRRPKN